MAVWVEGRECVRVPLTKGMFAIIDKEDAERVLAYNWCGHNKPFNYAMRNEGNKTVMLHRFILGSEAIGSQVDHANRDGLDNRRCNLRIATHSQNRANAKVNCGRQYKGVVLKANRFMVLIKKDGKNHYIGRFRSAKNAAMAYDHAAKRLFGEFARTNFNQH